MSTSIGNEQRKRIAAVLGSGGHTAEMFRLFTKLDADLKPRIFFLGQDDLLAPMLVSEYCKTYSIDVVEQRVIPRPRKVGQSYFTSIFTTVWTILFCIWSLVCDPLDLILCNGPGICVCIAIGAHLASIVCWRKRSNILYIESFARTKSLSLSGQLMQYLADKFIVQWPALDRKGSIMACPREYHGLAV